MELKNVNGSTILNYEDGELKTALSEAIRKGISLIGANLIGANLMGANLMGANLTWVNLYRTDLSWANLEGADLKEAYLEGSILYYANLKDANLAGAHLNGAVLNAAHLTGAQNIPYIPLACPSEGSFTGRTKRNEASCLFHRDRIKNKLPRRTTKPLDTAGSSKQN